MKIAVQLFGHLRDFELCAPSLHKHLLAHYDCDVFIHTWDMTEHQTPTWHTVTAPCRPTNTTDINRLYHPKALKIEHQPSGSAQEILCYSQGKDATISAVGIKFMLHSQIASNRLRQEYQQKHSQKYDYVILCRPDIFFKQDFVLEDYLPLLKISNFPPARYTCALTEGTHCHIMGDMVSDAFYMAVPEVMDSIMQTFQTLKFPHAFWNPETFIMSALAHAHIQTYCLNFPYQKKWELCRTLKHKPFSFRLKKNLFYLHLFGQLPFSILEFNCLLMKSFRLEIHLGAKLD